MRNGLAIEAGEGRLRLASSRRAAAPKQECSIAPAYTRLGGDADMPTQPRRVSAATRRRCGRGWLFVGAILLLAACASPTTKRPTGAAVQVVLNNLTGYRWHIVATDEQTRGQHEWTVWPHQATMVQLAAGNWQFTQTVPETGESRTVTVSLASGVTYDWPLATVYSTGERR